MKLKLIAFAVIGILAIMLVKGCKNDPNADSPTDVSSAGGGKAASTRPSKEKSSQTDSDSDNGKKDGGTAAAKTPEDSPAAKIDRSVQPDQVTIRYCIVGQFGSANPVGRERSAAQATELAAYLETLLLQGTERNDILLKLQERKLGSIGFGETTYLNFGIAGADPAKMIFPRESRPQVADAAFQLKVGEADTVPFNPTNPRSLGTWVIQRVK